MPENLIFISKRIVLNAICRSENFLWNFEVFVSSQAVSLRCSNEKLFTKHAILLHILLHISRTALHKKHLWETASLFHKFLSIMGNTLYTRYFFLYFLFICIENELLNLPPRRLLKADAIPTLFSYIAKGTNKLHGSEKREELSRKKQMSNKWLFVWLDHFRRGVIRTLSNI